jgi:ankyrin repeat protein
MTLDDFGQMIATNRITAELPAFLAVGGDVNAFDPRSAMPLLHLACEHQNMNAVRALVGAGADLEARDLFGQVALHIAVNIDIDAVVQADGQVSYMQFETTNLLLELGANPEERDDAGRSPRDLAAGYGQAVLDEFDRQTKRRI